MKKRVLAVILGAVMTMSLAACGSSDAGKTSSNDSEKSYTIGISQFAEHGSLDNCREGFLEGLKEEGIEFESSGVGWHYTHFEILCNDAEVGIIDNFLMEL